MALNPQFPNYANSDAGTEIIAWTVVGGLPLYRLPVKMVETGYGAAMVAGGSTIYPPDSDEFSPPKIITPGTLEGIFIEDQTITHTPAVVSGVVTTQTVTWWVRKNTGSVKVAENVDTYTLQAADVDGFLYVQVYIEGPNGEDSDVTQSYGPILPNTIPVPDLTATFTPSEEVGTAASLEITACTNGAVTRVQVIADQSGVIQDVPVSTLPVTVTQSGASLVRYVGQYLIFKVVVADGLGNNIIVTYTCGPIVGTAPVIEGIGDISGTATVGETLTFTPPTVTGIPTPTVVYNWYRQGSGVVINTGLTYVPTNDDLGKFLYVTTVATNPMGGDTATSLDFGPITGTAPVVVDPGVISPDSVEVGEVITLNPIPQFSGNPAPAVSWVWRDGLDEARVLQLGGLTYKAKASDIGRNIVVASTATNLSGSAEAVTNETHVEAGPPVIVTPSILFDLTPEVRQQIGGKKATFAGYPEPVVTSFGFWDYTDPLNPVQLVDGENVTTYDVKDEDFGKEIAFVTVAENEYGSVTSVSAISAPVTGFLVITGSSQLVFEAPVVAGTVISGGQASFNGVPDPIISQFGFAYENGDGTYTPILSTVGQTSYTVQESDEGTSIAFYTTATNASVPAGVTSYSNSTGPIGGEFKFVTNGTIEGFSGPAPEVGDTLTIVYPITVPRNQKNIPPGPVNLTWNWISSEDPTTPITTPNAETYTVKPSDFGNRISIVWLATDAAQSLGAQAPYTEPVGGTAPAVLTSGSIAGDVALIPSTLTLTPATFSGSNVTISWVWVDDLGTEWQTGGLTLTTTQQMKGRRMQVKTTATNFAGSVVDSSNFSDVIGNGYTPVFTYDGTVTGPLDYFRAIYNLDPARAETAGAPTPVTWQWITSSSFDGSTDVIVIPDVDNRLGISTVGLPSRWFQDRFIMVRSRATNSYGQSVETVSSSIGPMGQLPILTQRATLVGDFQVDSTVSIGNEWAFSNALLVSWVWVYSDDLLIDDKDTIFQVGGNEAIVPPEALGKYISTRGSGSNSYGTTVEGGGVYGPVKPNPNPIVEEEGVILGELVFGSEQQATFVLPRVRNVDIDARWSWVWDIEAPGGGWETIQYGGTTLALDWFDTKGGGPNVYGTHLIGKRIRVRYSIVNPSGGKTSRAVYSDGPTDCPIGTFGSAEIVISGGAKSPSGPAVFTGQTLTCELPRIEFMTVGMETTANPNPVEAPGISPTVTYDWIYANFSTGLTSFTVTQEGCYPVKPIISLPTSCLKNATVELNWAATKGVYIVNGVAPEEIVNNQGEITVEAPAGGVAPTVASVDYIQDDRGSVWIGGITFSDPGSGFSDADPIVVLLDGTPITNQEFVPVYGFLTDGVTIVNQGLGYVSTEVPIEVTSPYDLLPFVGQCNAITAAQVLASNTPTVTLPRTNPLPDNGIVGVSLTATGITDAVAPIVSQSNVLYQYFAPNSQTPAFINRPTIYGTANTDSVLSCNATFAAWRNPGAPDLGAINPALAAPAVEGAQPIFPSVITYTWKWFDPVQPAVIRTLNTADNSVPYIDLKNFSNILTVNGVIYCEVSIRTQPGGTPVTVSTPQIPFTFETGSSYNPSINWCGYLTFARQATLPNVSWKYTLDANLSHSGQPPLPGQLPTIYTRPIENYTCRIVQVYPDGTTLSFDFPKPSEAADGRVVFDVYTSNAWEPIANWVEIFYTSSAQLVCRSNVVGTAPVADYVVNGGMNPAFANPGQGTPNTSALTGSGGWVGTQGPLPTYTTGPNGILDTSITGAPPVGNLLLPNYAYNVPYSAIDFRGTIFTTPTVNVTTNDVLNGPTVSMQFNPNPDIGPAPSLEFYVGYGQWVSNTGLYGIGVQWDWRTEDLTNSGFVPASYANRWSLKDNFNRPTTGIIAPISAYGENQLRWSFGPKLPPWYINTAGFQYSINFGDNWKTLSSEDEYLVPRDWLRWALYDQSQADSVLPTDSGSTVKAWWVVASPDGSFIQRVAPIDPYALDEGWISKLFIRTEYLGKMIGIEIQPNGDPANTRVVPAGWSQYYWAGYCSTSRQLMAPFPPTV